MICKKCNLSFSKNVKVCPKCNEDTIINRRVENRRNDPDNFSGTDRRMSDRRKSLINRFDEVFWKGNAKYC